MITETIRLSKAIRTSFGMQYEVQWDVNPAAKSASGLAGCAIALPGGVFKQGDRVQLMYRSTSSYGLWFIHPITLPAEKI